MAEYIEAKWDKVVQNLCDAGCESEDIQRFVQVLEAGQYREALCLLKKYRQILLDRCHAEEESNINILVLNGSPRPGGNTKQMVAAFREGAQSVGHTVEVVDVCKKQIGGCQACEYCHTRGNGQCIQKDDMQQIYDLLKQADTLVLGLSHLLPWPVRPAKMRHRPFLCSGLSPKAAAPVQGGYDPQLRRCRDV